MQDESLFPFKSMFLPAIEQSKTKHGKKDQDFNESSYSNFPDNCCPWENEYCFNIENEEYNCKQVVSYSILQPGAPDSFDTAFVRLKF